MGGMTCFGPVQRENQERVFHAPWERRVFALTILTMGQVTNLDEFRHAIERMDPAHYLASSYYEHWLTSLTTLLVEKGVATLEELSGGTAMRTATSARAPFGPDEVRMIARHGGSAQRRVGRTAPRFKIGDHVIARNFHPPGHTRIPRYVRGKRGVIERAHGTFVFPDTHAHGGGEQPQPVYGVRFAARELWGSSASARDSLCIDLWEDYLEES
jgi:nitrile hydratase subunit beta